MGFRPFVGSVHLNRFDPSWVRLLWVRPLRGLAEVWSLLLLYPSTLWTRVSILGLSTLGISMFFTLIGSVHFVNYGLDPWWVRPFCGLVLTLGGVLLLCGLVQVWDPGGVCPLCGLGSWLLVGSVHFVELYKFETLVGSVHFVDWGLDPW